MLTPLALIEERLNIFILDFLGLEWTRCFLVYQKIRFTKIGLAIHLMNSHNFFNLRSTRS